jgi:hypothetical protein
MTSIKIPANYETKDALIEALSKKIGRSKIFYNYQSRLWTEIKADQTFVLTCDGKRLGSFEFIGKISEDESGLYLEGYVQKRPDILLRQKLYSVMMIVIALLMFTTLNVVFIFMGILFILVTLINLTFFKDESPFIEFLKKTLQT